MLRLLGETHAILRDLQTKIGHAELAKIEAVKALQLEREASGRVQTEVDACFDELRQIQQRIQTTEGCASALRVRLAEEHQARMVAEKVSARRGDRA